MADQVAPPPDEVAAQGDEAAAHEEPMSLLGLSGDILEAILRKLELDDAGTSRPVIDARALCAIRGVCRQLHAAVTTSVDGKPPLMAEARVLYRGVVYPVRAAIDVPTELLCTRYWRKHSPFNLDSASDATRWVAHGSGKNVVVEHATCGLCGENAVGRGCDPRYKGVSMPYRRACDWTERRCACTGFLACHVKPTPEPYEARRRPPPTNQIHYPEQARARLAGAYIRRVPAVLRPDYRGRRQSLLGQAAAQGGELRSPRSPAGTGGASCCSFHGPLPASALHQLSHEYSCPRTIHAPNEQYDPCRCESTAVLWSLLMRTSFPHLICCER